MYKLNTNRLIFSVVKLAAGLIIIGAGQLFIIVHFRNIVFVDEFLLNGRINKDILVPYLVLILIMMLTMVIAMETRMLLRRKNRKLAMLRNPTP
jgi:hypothetical protein